MDSRLIRLQDGMLVEIETGKPPPRELAGSVADKVNGSIEEIGPLLGKIVHAFRSAWDEMNQDMDIQQAKIELGVSFEGEGNLYLAKATASANLIVKLTLKPKGEKHERYLG